MENTKNNSPKFAFWYLLSLVSLVFVAFSVGASIFQLINKYVPDIVTQNYQYSVSMELLKFAISALIVAAPLYFWMQTLIFKNLKSGELDKEVGVRKWLTYFILLVAAVVVLGYLIATINSLLDGELTTKFIFKTLTVIMIAAIIFSFYFYDIKRELVTNGKDKVITAYLFGSLIIVLASLVFAFTIIESPLVARNKKIDRQIVDNYYQINAAINNYYTANKKLPNDLNILLEVDNNYLTTNNITNPNTKKNIEYKIVAEKQYDLCTDFLTDSAQEQYQTEWKHKLGYDCITMTIYAADPQLMMKF